MRTLTPGNANPREILHERGRHFRESRRASRAVGQNRLMIALFATIGGLAAWLLKRAWHRRRRRLPGQALIASARPSTTIAADGAVHSLQSAMLVLPAAELERLWTPAQLENLGRTYWQFLSRVTLGAVRVLYSDEGRSVVLLSRRLTLLRFATPTYAFESDRGRLSWAIRDGLLVSRSGHSSGFLALTVRRAGDRRRLPRAGAADGDYATLLIDVEVANFYPSIASRLGTPVYRASQSLVHVLVTHAFLRSLATLELKRSGVRRFG